MSLLSNGNSPDDLFSFAGSVGRFGDNNREDVIKAQALLANAGYYELPDPGMPTGWPGGELNRALTRFQKDHGLEPDGTLLPLGPFGVGETGVGETAQALKLQLFDTLQHHAAPTVSEVDSFYRGRRPGEP
jgi:peptidoglycan hydrolase-like protein with peptidoglycan-binding domain